MRFLLLFFITINFTFAAPALNIEREFKQSDGTIFKARAKGNQHLNWIETKDGEILKYNKENNNFEYATIKKEKLKASGVKFEKNSSKRVRSLAKINKIDKKKLYELWAKKRKEANKRKIVKPIYK